MEQKSDSEDPATSYPQVEEFKSYNNAAEKSQTVNYAQMEQFNDSEDEIINEQKEKLKFESSAVEKSRTPASVGEVNNHEIEIRNVKERSLSEGHDLSTEHIKMELPSKEKSEAESDV